MITVNVKQLASALAEADVFTLPVMSEGTGYLYNSVYARLSRGEEVSLLGLDFNAFDPDDIDSLNELYDCVFERNYYAADKISYILRNTAPVCKAVSYV